MKGIIILVLAAVIGVQSHRLVRDAPPREFSIFNFIMGGNEMPIVRAQCARESGSEAAFNNMEANFMKFYVCVAKSIDIETAQNNFQIKVNTANTSTPAVLEAIFTEVCPQLKNFDFLCLNEFIASGIRPCLTASEFVALDELVKSLPKVFDHVCYNNGERIIQLVNSATEACFVDNREVLNGCFTRKLTTDKNEFDCNKFDGMKTCVENELSSCKNTTVSGIAGGFFDTVREEIKCTTIDNEI